MFRPLWSCLHCPGVSVPVCRTMAFPSTQTLSACIPLVCQVVANRQPADVYHGLMNGNYTQLQCHADLKCYQHHRDQDLSVHPGGTGIGGSPRKQQCPGVRRGRGHENRHVCFTCAVSIGVPISLVSGGHTLQCSDPSYTDGIRSQGGL